jgi:hypothetical protein
MYRALPDPDTGSTPFSFEHVWEMREDDYLASYDLPRSHSLRARVKLGVVALVGILLLLAPYSAAIGVLLIILSVLIWFLPRMARHELGARFEGTPYLRGPISFGVSRGGMWLKGAHVGAESDWEGLVGWRERDGWLILSASGIPPVYLPIAALRQHGLYDAVVFLARAHGRQMGTGRRAPAHSDVPG